MTASELQLPRAWPDYVFLRFAAFLRFFRTLLFGGKEVQLPPQLPGATELPQYLLREFHRMPNGYYSNFLAEGYERGFERSMLGHVTPVRRWIASQVQHCRSVLDIGCGSGKVAGAVSAAGVPDVWGLDASWYQLRIAQRDFPHVSFAQGLAEKAPFEDGRFDAVTACFLFHELPFAVQDSVLAEMHRLLKPGGRMVISEPSPEQLRTRNFVELWKMGGWRGIYFHLLAVLVTEPYAAEWHGRDIEDWATRSGFCVETDDSKIPFRRIVLRRL